MAKADWKDILHTNLGNTVTSSTGEKEGSPIKKGTDKRQDLIIRFEKRNGKPATIVSNFQGSEAELKDLAGKLKKFCGVGGSAKDDEILIQGDARLKIADYLRKQGHQVRGDFKK
jgi:translation initiation factor 1